MKLKKLQDESNFRKLLDHEDEQKRIQEIFECINEARVQFEVGIACLDGFSTMNSV